MDLVFDDQQLVAVKNLAQEIGGARRVGVTHVDCDEADQQMELMMRLFADPNPVIPQSDDFLPFLKSSQTSADDDEIESSASSSSASSTSSSTTCKQKNDSLWSGQEFDLFVVGGYEDEAGESIKTTNSLLRFALTSPIQFHLQLFFVGTLMGPLLLSNFERFLLLSFSLCVFIVSFAFQVLLIRSLILKSTCRCAT
jgi:hypothetical protein